MAVDGALDCLDAIEGMPQMHNQLVQGTWHQPLYSIFFPNWRRLFVSAPGVANELRTYAYQ